MLLEADNQLTLQEFLNLSPEEGDITYELIDGQAIPKMSPKFFHAKLTHAILNLVEEWCQGNGVVCPEWAVLLTKQGKDWIPVPDIVYISHERLPPDWNEDEACPVPPDLVIEIISPGQTFGQIMAKAKHYLDANVLRMWVLDSKARSMTVFYPDAAPKTYVGDELIADSLFPGWEFTAEQVFQKAKIPLN